MNYFRCGGGRSIHTATKLDFAKSPIATFSSNVSGLYLPEVLAYITATQSGTGTPSPSNPRPITGHTQAVVTNNSNTYTTNLGGTYYLCTLNVGKGLLTVLGIYFVFNSAEYYGTYGYEDAPLFYVDITDEGIARMENTNYDIFLISNMLTKITTAATQRMRNYEIRTEANNNPTKLYFRMDDYTSKAAIDAFLADNPLQVVAELATPQTIQLTPQEIEQYLQNTMWVSTGDVSGKYYRVD